jgi:hypothetical protein
MGWLADVLARVSGLGRRRRQGTELQEVREEIRRLRAQVARQRERLAVEKRKRARITRRLADLANAVAGAPAATPAAAGHGRPLLVFEHVPKTAGTTFRRSYLRAALPRHERWILSGGTANEAERRRFLSMSETRRRRYRVVAGHYAETLRPHLPLARFVTIVREPVARTISEYLHVLHHPSATTAWESVRREGLSLGDYVEQHGRQDLQSRMLLGVADDTLDDEAIARHLDGRYALVGLTEAFDEFVFLLHLAEGLPLCLYNKRLVRPEREAFVPPADDLDRVARATRVDARLYAVVRARFEARLAALAPEARARLQRWREALDDFRQRTGGDVEQAERLPDDW